MKQNTKFGKESTYFSGDISDFQFSDKPFTVTFSMPVIKPKKKTLSQLWKEFSQRVVKNTINSLFWFSCLDTILFIEFSAMMIFWKMKLKPISIKYDANYGNCHFGYHKEGKHELIFGLLLIGNDDGVKSLDKDVFKYLNYNFKTVYEKIFFVVAHEIGHYVQYERHHGWVTRKHWGFMPMFLMDAETYRKHPVEANADKIAIGICKKFKIGSEK